jgi:hypothetical protein
MAAIAGVAKGRGYCRYVLSDLMVWRQPCTADSAQRYDQPWDCSTGKLQETAAPYQIHAGEVVGYHGRKRTCADKSVYAGIAFGDEDAWVKLYDPSAPSVTLQRCKQPEHDGVRLLREAQLHHGYKYGYGAPPSDE